MKQSTLKLRMTATLLLSFLPSFAYDFEIDGICYEISSFTEMLAMASSISDVAAGEIIIPSTVEFNGKTLSVIAVGDEFALGNQKITALYIGDGVKEIGLSAFEGCSNISNVEIPESVQSIKSNAFANCVSIKDVEAYGVESMGEYAFSGCVSIERVSFPKLLYIPTAAFSGCSNLSSLNFSLAQTIGNSSFAGCAFSSFDVPSSVTKIESNAFSNCQELESFVIPNNVTSIESDLFSNCSSLKEVHIGSGIKRLPWIFENCNNLEILRIEDSEYTLTFEYCGTRNFSDGTTGNPINYKSYEYAPVSSMFKNTNLKEVYIGRNITTEAFCYKSVYMSGSYDGRYYYYIPNPPFSGSSISKLEIGQLVTNFKMCDSRSSGYLEYVKGSWDGAFQNCVNLEEINIQSSATSISDNSFAGCKSLQEISIPNSVKSLGTGVFQNCISLKTINLGCYLTSIGNNALTGDDALSSINLRSSNPPTYPTGFSSSEYISTNVKIPSGSIDKYKDSEPWMNFWNIEEDPELITLFEVDEIQYIVSNNNNIQIVGTSSSLPKKLSISSSVLYSGTEFILTTISDNAFKDCEMIESMEIGEGISYIGDNAFEGCKNMKEVSLPMTLSNLGSGAFKNCNNLEIINYAKPLENIPKECFYGCSSLSDFSFEGVITIGNSSFYNCNGMTKIVIAPSVVAIGSEAFSACRNLEEFVIADSNSMIDISSGSYDGATSIQKKEVNGKTIQFKIQYYNGCFSGLPIEKLYIGRNLSDKSRYTISGDGGVDYYLITSYDAPFNSLTKLKELEIGENVSVLGPVEEYISEVEMYSTPGSFKKCSNIEKVIVKNTNPPIGAEFSSNTYDTANLIVPDNTISLYEVAEGWKDFVNIIDESSAGIEDVLGESNRIPFCFRNGEIVWTGDSDDNVKIYTIDGRLLKSIKMRADDYMTIESGLYIINTSHGVFKIRL